MNTRADLPAARRVVVKVGSRVLADQDSLIQRLAGEVHEQRQQRRSFVLVSSGAIALGSQRLGYAKRPTEVARLQQVAADHAQHLRQHLNDVLDRLDSARS